MLEQKQNLGGQVEKCPAINYCVPGARLSPEEVCNGTKGDYTKCGVYQHYTREDFEHHHPPIESITFHRPTRLLLRMYETLFEKLLKE